MKVYRQGDVMLIEVPAIPTDAKAVALKGEVILAHGEMTGHKHRFEDAFDLRMYAADGGTRYLEVAGIKMLMHEEHTAVKVPPGKYLIPNQVEFTPAELRRVAD